MQNDSLRIAAYARVSTDSDDQANSLVSQKKYFGEYIGHHKEWKFSGVYYDEGVSGTQTKRRTGFNQMVGDALSGEFDLILTKEVCRFARNTVDTLSYTRRLKEAGVGVIFTIDNIDTRDSDGELRLTIMASIAQEESRKTSERVKWGQKRRMEQGVVFGRDMLGYSVKNGVLSINEDEVPAVKAIFHKYTNEGKGTHVIARELMEEGFRPKRISLWSNTVILRILRNEKYVGDLCQKKTYTPNYLTHDKKYNRGIEEKVYIRDHHEPIIDRELWDRTQEELHRRSLSAARKTKHSNRYWCSGKIRCGECGCRFISRTKKLAGGTYKAWRCYQTANYGSLKMDADGKKIGCNNNSINEKALLACMKYCISLICCNRNTLKKEILSCVREVCGVEKIVFDEDRIIQKIDKIESKKRKTFDAMLEGIITKEELKKQSEWYDKELAALENLLAENKQKSRQYDKRKDDITCFEKALDEILSTFERIKKYNENENMGNVGKPYSIEVRGTERKINIYGIASTRFDMGELSRGEEMFREKDIETLRKLFRQYNYVMTTAELTASKLYYADIKLLLEEELIEKIKRGYYYWIEDCGESEIVIINRLFPNVVLCMETALFYYKYSDSYGICENTAGAEEGERFDWGVVVMVGKAVYVF